jgi:hypothetical protein
VGFSINESLSSSYHISRALLRGSCQPAFYTSSRGVSSYCGRSTLSHGSAWLTRRSSACNWSLLLGDTAWFLIGRKHGSRVLRFFAAFSADPNEQIRKTKRIFEKHGLRCLLIAKFVPGINAVAPPLAGMLGSSISRFLVLIRKPVPSMLLTDFILGCRRVEPGPRTVGRSEVDPTNPPD